MDGPYECIGISSEDWSVDGSIKNGVQFFMPDFSHYPHIEVLATVLFGLAILHTFCTPVLLKWSHLFEKKSLSHLVLHWLAEIEVVFGLWAVILFLLIGALHGFNFVVSYHESLSFNEPIFVFCIMVVAATGPVLQLAQKALLVLGALLSKVLRIDEVLADLFIVLSLGPLLGSFITEPAAMTVTALLTLKMINKKSDWFLHFLLALLFVNISVGGALTPFAAPPILMVAKTWGWDFSFVFSQLGWKSAIAVFINSAVFVFVFRKSIRQNFLALAEIKHEAVAFPALVVSAHYLFLIMIVVCAHHPKMAVGIFLLFLGFTTLVNQVQDRLRLRESLLVAFFLAGIIIFGPFQRWWLEPLLVKADSLKLFLGSILLTSITDNAALTYLGSQVPALGLQARYYLVAGALAGGGLTIIANAPNAVGYGLLQNKFSRGFHPGKLFLAAIAPTLVVAAALWFF